MTAFNATSCAALLLVLPLALAATCPASCNLPQCPCYHAQVDGANYVRPPGCVASATSPTMATTCRLPDSAYPEPTQYAPQQIHVQPADPSFTYLFVVWATGFAIDLVPEVPTNVTYGIGKLPSQPSDALSVVWFGTNYTAVNTQKVAPVVADPTKANQVYTSFGVPQYFSPVIHTVKIGPLVSNTFYYYSVGDPTKTKGISATFTVKTPPAAGKKSDASCLYPFRFGVIADVGQTFNSSTTLNHLSQEYSYGAPLHAVLLAGDLSYADDYQADQRFGYQPRWDVWGRFTQSLFTRVPLITTIGNHEEESEFTFGDDYTMFTNCTYPQSSPPSPGAIGGSGGDCARSWLYRYPTPYFSSTPGPNDSPFWYSLNTGPAHLIVLSNYAASCTPTSPTSLSCPGIPALGTQKASPQYTWLLNDLQHVFNRTLTPWLIVMYHEPYYSSQGTYGQATYFQQNLEGVFYQYGVDLVINGHVHAYERSFPVYNGVIDECAPVYFVIGDAGNEEGPDDYSGADPVWSAHRESSFGHARLDLLNSTSASWYWNRNQDPDIHTTADTVNITRATHANGCSNRAA